MPAGGGARFLPGGQATDRYEYRVPGGTHHVYVDADLIDQLSSQLDQLTGAPSLGDQLMAVVNDPANHLHFNDPVDGTPDGISTIGIASCAAGHPTTTSLQEMLRIVQNPAGACQ
jgi:hypothetical protein